MAAQIIDIAAIDRMIADQPDAQPVRQQDLIGDGGHVGAR
jgi:hypothetical protein